MLSKLLKYDLKKIYKFMSVFYIISVVCALITLFFLQFKNSFALYLTGEIFRGATLSAIVSTVINNLMRLWVTFKNGFYGDESYLTHTLPVTKSELYLSKFITAIVTTLTTTVVIAGSLMIIYSAEIKNLIQTLAGIYGTSVPKFAAALSAVYFLEVSVALLVGYTGILLGHRSNNQRTLKSVIWGIVLYVLSQMLLLLTLFTVGLFNSEVMRIFSESTATLKMIKTVLLIAGILYGITVPVLGLIDIKIFNKGVNVE